MKLRFFARRGPDGVPHFVNWPGLRGVGQSIPRVGRTFVGGSSPASPASYPASKVAAEVDDGAAEAPHLIRQCQKGGLWAADEATAAACGVEFVKPVQDADGEWVAALPNSPAPSMNAPKKNEPKAEA
jgi:hypothetical protein